MGTYEHIEHGFDPVFNRYSRFLILGSFPSVASRDNGFFYGNPQNRFWRVIAALTESSVPPNEFLEVSIAEKKRLLLENNIALWDVVESCDIVGSSDQSIKNVQPVDIARILEVCDISAVYANGRTAERLYRRYLEPQAGQGITALPSTSPANAAYSLERLTRYWEERMRLSG